MTDIVANDDDTPAIIVKPRLHKERALGLDQIKLVSLLTAVGHGDRQAFRALYHAASPKLFGILLRMIKDRSAAEDALQDVFLRIWKNAVTYAPEAGDPMAWMNAIARNRAIDFLRVKAPIRQEAGEDGIDWLEKIADPRDDAAQAMNASALRFCLERIEEPVRSCIVEAYCEGRSRDELANKYDRPVNTIKTLLHRGLAALKTCLEQNA
jgi:RNA polymerase sigma factor (sigma-70 family)